jgi:hypothetical protein
MFVVVVSIVVVAGLREMPPPTRVALLLARATTREDDDGDDIDAIAVLDESRTRRTTTKMTTSANAIIDAANKTTTPPDSVGRTPPPPPLLLSLARPWPYVFCFPLIFVVTWSLVTCDGQKDSVIRAPKQAGRNRGKEQTTDGQYGTCPMYMLSYLLYPLYPIRYKFNCYLFAPPKSRKHFNK